MSVEIKLKKKIKEESESETISPADQKEEICDLDKINKLYSKKCGANNKEQLQIELSNREELGKYSDENEYLYPTLDDPNFNIKIAQKKSLVILNTMVLFIMLRNMPTF